MSAAAVVIPTRDRPRELETAVASVRAQTLTDWELVVVDDASTHDVLGFLDGLGDPRIRALRLTENAERSAARNRGLALVSSPAVLFLDDDDELLPEALEALTNALNRHPTACVAVGAVIHEQRDGTRRRIRFPARGGSLDVRLELLAGWLALSGQSLMRAEVVTELGGWREGLSVAEDQELWLRLCRKGPVAIVPDTVLVHRPHGLDGDAPDFRDVERAVVARHLREVSDDRRRATRAARAREHLRDADISFQRGAYRGALGATARGIAAAPFLLRSPLVGPLITRGFANALVAGALPHGAAERLVGAVRERRTRASL